MNYGFTIAAAVVATLVFTITDTKIMGYEGFLIFQGVFAVYISTSALSKWRDAEVWKAKKEALTDVIEFRKKISRTIDELKPIAFEIDEIIDTYESSDREVKSILSFKHDFPTLINKITSTAINVDEKEFADLIRKRLTSISVVHARDYSQSILSRTTKLLTNQDSGNTYIAELRKIYIHIKILPISILRKKDTYFFFY